MVHPHELPADAAPVAQFAAMLRGTSKPLIMVPEDARHLEVFNEMAAACGAAGSWGIYAMPTPPLTHGKESVDRLVGCARLGIPMIYASAFLPGATAPASVAGCVVLANAEMLSGLRDHAARPRRRSLRLRGVPGLDGAALRAHRVLRPGGDGRAAGLRRHVAALRPALVRRRRVLRRAAAGRAVGVRDRDDPADRGAVGRHPAARHRLRRLRHRLVLRDDGGRRRAGGLGQGVSGRGDDRRGVARRGRDRRRRARRDPSRPQVLTAAPARLLPAAPDRPGLARVLAGRRRGLPARPRGGAHARAARRPSAPIARPTRRSANSSAWWTRPSDLPAGSAPTADDHDGGTDERATPPQLGGALQDQDGGAPQDDHARGARGRHPRGRLQHLPAAQRGRLHRPAHRLRHDRDERPPVGRHDARRRGLRREPQLLPSRSGRPGDLRLHAPGADAPGPRRRAPAQPDADQARRRDPRQHVLHHHPPPPGAGRRPLRRRDHRRGPRPHQRAPLQGRRRPRQAADGSSTRSAPSTSPTSASPPP